jgi:hypothetical protein
MEMRMTKKSLWPAAVITLLFLVTIFHLAAKAHSPDSTPQAIRTAIIQAIGADER